MSSRFGIYFGRAFSQNPGANNYRGEGYLDRLRSAGFQQIEMRSIRDQVYQPFAAYARRRLGEPQIKGRLHPVVRMLWTIGVRRRFITEGLDYLIVTAHKSTRSRTTQAGPHRDATRALSRVPGRRH